MIKYLVAVIALVVLIWGVQLAVLYSHIGSYKKYWEKQNAQTVAGDPIIYMALGDSTAQGIGASNPKHSYPVLIARWLNHETGRPVRLINVSVSGAKVNGVVTKQIPLLAAYPKPDITTIEIGANDMSVFNEQSFTAQMQTLVKLLPPYTYISDIPAFTGRAKGKDPLAVKAGNIIHQSIQGTDLRFVNLYNATKSNSGIGYFAADWFHPNNKAYIKWAQAFEATMTTRVTELKR